MEKTTDTVASEMPSPSAGRTLSHRVVSPPSARMKTRATKPSCSVSSGLVRSMMPKLSMPSTIPMPRYSSNDGMPSRRESRTAISASSSTREAMPKAPSGVDRSRSSPITGEWRVPYPVR